MTLHKPLRIIATGALAALLVAAPVAEAKQAPASDIIVCNQATPVSLGGDYVATDGDPTPPARYQEDLQAHRGKGRGLVNAAAHSPALSQCGGGASEDSAVGEDAGGDLGGLPDYGVS